MRKNAGKDNVLDVKSVLEALDVVYRPLKEEDLPAFFSNLEDCKNFKRCKNCESVLRIDRTECFICKTNYSLWKRGIFSGSGSNEDESEDRGTGGKRRRRKAKV